MKVLLVVLACAVLLSSGFAPVLSMPAGPPEASQADRAAPDPAATFTNATPGAGLAGVGGNFFAWGDYDNDGHQDLLVDGQRLFHNNGPPGWTFTEVTAKAGIGGSGANTGNWADYDNDGYLDLYCPSGGWSTDYSPLWDILWHNNGDGTFTNVTEKAGHVTDTFPSVAAGWGDYNRDGFVDVYVANYENASMSSYYPDVLWKNNGDGTFTNVTRAAGVDESADAKPGRSVSWCDFNNDGWPDLYVSNYRLKANYLYLNDKDGTFTDVAAARGVQGEPNNRLGQTYYGHSVGAAWSDINNDGNFDLWVTNLAHKDAYRGPICDDSELYLSGGNASHYNFTNIRSGSGIPLKRILGGEDELFVGCCWGDFDNDGYEDLFLPQIYNDVGYAYSFLYHNNGNNTFTDVSNQTGVRVWDTYGGCWCDYDEDGDLDLLTGGKGTSDINGTHELHLYKNMLNEKGSSTWLELRLTGTESNRAAIGARVYARCGGKSQMREVQGGMGPHSMQNSMTVHFGFPSDTSSVSIGIFWPSGTVQTIEYDKSYPVDHLNQIVEVTESSTQADLTPILLDFTPVAPVEGDAVSIHATIQNIGDAASTKYHVRIIDGSDQLHDYDNSEPIGAGNTSFFEYSWDTTGLAGNHNVSVIAYSTDPNDINWTNERLSRQLFIAAVGGGTPPVARLGVTPVSAVINQTVNFDGSTSSDLDGTVKAYEFTFGDGMTTGWIANPWAQHAYSKTGSYSATLRVRDDSNIVSNNTDRVTITVSLTANKPPGASIVSILPSPATKGAAVTFTGESSDPDGTVAAHCWTSSIDGNLSTDQSFQTSSLSVGTHTISFRAQDDRGDWSTPAIRTLEVRLPALNQPPTAFIVSISPSPAREGDTVSLTGSGQDPDGTVAEYRWSSSLQGQLGSGSTLKIKDLVQGVHIISLKVKDDKGAWSPEATKRLEVLAPLEGEIANLPPRASLNVTPLSVMVNELVHIDASGSNDTDGRVVEYYFDFGDGTQLCWTVSSAADHIYSGPGQYVVRCKVKDEDGTQSPWTRDLIVEVRAKKPIQPSQGFIPGMEAALALAVIVLAIVVSRRRRS